VAIGGDKGRLEVTISFNYRKTAVHKRQQTGVKMFRQTIVVFILEFSW